MNYIYFAWITSVLYAGSGLVGKFAAKHALKNPWLYNFLWSLCIVLVSCSAALYFGIRPVTDWPSILFAGLLSAATAATYTFAVYLLDISILAPLYTLRAPMSVVLGVLLFGEALTANQIVLIGIMTVAGMLVSIDERLSLRSFFTKSIAFALFTILLSSVYNAYVRVAVEQNGYWTTVFWYNLFNQVFLLPTIPLFMKDRRQITRSALSLIAVSAVFASIGGITAIMATLGNLGISMAILTVPLSTIVVMILSRYMPKLLEHHPPNVYVIRLGAAFVMFACALGLSS